MNKFCPAKKLFILCLFLTLTAELKSESFNFEKSMTSWTVGSNQVKISIPGEDSVIAMGGPKSGKALELTFNNGKKENKVLSPSIKTPSDTICSFSLMVVSEFSKSSPVIQLLCYDTRKKLIKQIEAANITEIGKWIKIELKTKTPKQCSYVKIAISAHTPDAKGSCMIGDIEFNELKTAASNVIEQTKIIKAVPDENSPEEPTPQLAKDNIKALFRLPAKEMEGWKYTSPKILTADVSISDSFPLHDKESLKVSFIPLKENNEKCYITLIPPEKKAPEINTFDTISFWMTGEFLYKNIRKYNIQPVIAFIFSDETGKIFELKTFPIYWNPWAIARIHTDKHDGKLKLRSIRIENLYDSSKDKLQKKLCFYINNIKFYEKKNFNNFKISDSHYPKDKDILPYAKQSFVIPEKIGNTYVFKSQFNGSEIKFEWQPKTGTMEDFSISIDGGKKKPFASGAGFEIILPDGTCHSIPNRSISPSLGNLRLDGNTLCFDWNFFLDDKKILSISYKIEVTGNSLIAEITSDDKVVKICSIGDPVSFGAKGIIIPYLLFRAGPSIFLWGKDFFSSQIWDWRKTNSTIFLDSKEAGYSKKTDGTMNPLHERIVYSFSRNICDVFPRIPNPSTPFKNFLKNHIMLKMFCCDFSKVISFAKLCKEYGLEGLMFSFHAGLWNPKGPRGGGYPWAQTSTVHPRWGGNKAFKAFCKQIHGMGYKINVFDDYVPSMPLSRHFDENDLAVLMCGRWGMNPDKRQDGWGWFGSPLISPCATPELARKNALDLKKKYDVDSIYSDQITMNSYFTRTDCDHRKPLAGMSKAALFSYAKTYLDQKNASKGPIISEGGSQWFLSGFVDANYGTLLVPGKGYEFPLMVNFKLMRIHPLEATLGMGPGGATFDMPTEDFKYPHYKGLDRFIATSMAYGNAAVFYYPYIPLSRANKKDIVCDKDWRALLRYYFLYKCVQEKMLFEKVDSIEYWINNKFHKLSEAIIDSGENSLRKVKVTYKNALTVYVNGSLDKKNHWKINTGDETVTLPAPGFLALFKGKIISASILLEGMRVDYACCENYTYFDGRGELNHFKGIKSDGQVILLKKQPDIWKLIPRDAEKCELENELFKGRKLEKITPVDATGNTIELNCSAEYKNLKFQLPFAYNLRFQKIER